MTLNQLKLIMRKHLKHFGVYTTTPGNQTVFSDVLDDGDGIGIATSMRLFKASVRRDIAMNGQAEKTWPSGWQQENIDSLAPKLL